MRRDDGGGGPVPTGEPPERRPLGAVTAAELKTQGAPGPKHKRDLTRRKVVVAGAGAVAGVAAGGVVVATASAGTTEKETATPLSSTGASVGVENREVTDVR